MKNWSKTEKGLGKIKFRTVDNTWPNLKFD